ncbi:uncharacterized protein [Prorops nasuta]|uniref:uncharacterized protein n=1 Tax=Prorops nasuta TaxID=863751 RepID=UPI0034D002C1
MILMENFQLQELNDNSKATQIKDKRTTWSINETLTLLTAVEARYDDMHHIHKRKTFWTIISEELCSQNIEVSEAVCKKKWQNLVRTYKSRKDIKSRTGRGPVKFVFYNRLDELLGDSPTNACQHSIDVNDINTEETQVESIAQPEVENFEEHLDDPSSNSSSSSSSSKRKRKNPTIELVKIKKDFLENKMIVMKEKEESRKVYIKESLKYNEEKVRLYKDKMEMEKKKIEALISLQKVLKEKKCV